MASLTAELTSSSTHGCPYHVFLSFRGEDTRKTFTDHLYTALSGSGFCTFRDDDGIERCEGVKSELDKAIKQARSSIVVFSKNYASSRWCLDELVMILERKRTSRHVILPVFYHVDPSEVRKQTGSFAEAFSTHEEQFKMDTNKVQGWRTALREVAGLAGMALQNQADGHESKFIQKVVKVIRDKLNHPVLHVAPYLIGIRYRAQNINLWLLEESDDVDIALIYGMGGIGKTTIAKFVYNLNIERFEACSFLANIREISEEPNGLVHLQRQLLSDILKWEKEKICSVDEGINMIKDAIGCKRVFIVLDDVDQRDQFDAVIGMREWFHPGSKIILTTRNKHLLRANEVDKIFEVERFDFNESLELFSWYAFGQGPPIEGCIEHSKRVVQHCGGLPLALQVLGSSLSGKSLDIWENALQKLAAIPDSKIHKKMKISFDSLQDDHDKNLFLHIACFFIGKDKDIAVSILAECDFYPTIGIQNLIDRCLLTIEGNKLMMHQLLRDMGREIVRQESPKEPGKRSRLWHHKDSFNVLSEETGTKTIEGLFLDMHLFEEDKYSKTSFGATNNAKRPQFEELNDESLVVDQGNSVKWLGFFSRHPINNAVRNSNQVHLKTDAFARMDNLRLLQLNYVEIKGGYKDFPRGLRWLSWHGFPLKSIPNELSLKSLVGLDMRYSKLEHAWKETKLMSSLKILDLSHSHGLINTPNFTGLPNLETLVLNDCIHLVEVHESIGELKRLVSLNLKGCKNLKKLPCEIGHLTSLEKLILSVCSKLIQLPAELGKMKSLTEFHGDGIFMNRTSTTTDENRSLSSLFWSWVLKPIKRRVSMCISLASLPDSLTSLNLSSCNLSSDDVAKCLGRLSMLRKLDLSKNPISNLPESIKGLTMLQSLKLSYCRKLRSLPQLSMSLELLDVSECWSLEIVTNLPNLFTLLKLNLNRCKKLVEVQGMFKLEPIENADAGILYNLGFLTELESIGCLELEMYNNMTYEYKKGPPQVLYECGIYSLFLPGHRFCFNEVASRCRRGERWGSSISFTVPALPNFKIQALNIYVVIACVSGDTDWKFDFIKIHNKTKGLNWAYSPTFRGVLDGNGMVWLSHWKIGNQLVLEDGDRVKVSAILFTHKVKEIGVEIVYDEREEKGIQHQHQHQNNTRSSPHNYVINVGDLSPYHVKTGSYFLCHHDYQYHQDYRRDGQSSSWDEILFGDSNL